MPLINLKNDHDPLQGQSSFRPNDIGKWVVNGGVGVPMHRLDRVRQKFKEPR